MRRGLRALASSLWPLGLALQVSVVGGAGWSEPDSTSRAMGATTVAFLVALLGLEQVLPYRREWSIRGDREVWRDLGHAVLYTTLGWPAHAIHHTPIRLNALKGPRHHVVYFLGRGVFVWAPF